MTVFMQMPCHSQWQIKRSSLQPPAVSLPQWIDCCHILMTPKHQKYFAASDVSCSFLATFASDMPHRAKSWMPSQCVQYFVTVCSEVLFNLGLLVKRRMFFFCSQKSRASGPTLTASCLWEPPSFGLVFCLWGVYCQRVRPFMSPSIQGEPASALLWIYFLW